MENMFLKSILIIIVAFISYMHCYWGSTMANRPIIVSPLVGLVLGDLTAGIVIGATLELIFLGAVPIGASNPPDMTSGAIIGTSFAILTGANIGTSVALAVPVATLVLLFDNVQMMFFLTWAAHLADKYAEEGNYRMVEVIARIAGIGNKVILALVVGIAFYLGVPVIDKILEAIPGFVIEGMDIAAGILPALGFAMIAKMIITKELAPYLLAGFLLTAYFGISTFGVALFGLVVAALIFYEDKNKGRRILDDNEF